MTRPRTSVVALASGIIAIGIGITGLSAGPSHDPAQNQGSRNLTYLTKLEPTPGTTVNTKFETPGKSPAEADWVNQPDPPESIAIHAIDVNTAVKPVTLDENGGIEIPADISKTGWYSPGVTPGSAQGSAVIVAHRDGKNGHGVFYNLGNLTLGDTVRITTSSGQQLKYKVVAKELLPKDQYKKAAPELFSTDGPARLTLISCGGYYDRANGGYQANIIVTAVPV